MGVMVLEFILPNVLTSRRLSPNNSRPAEEQATMLVGPSGMNHTAELEITSVSNPCVHPKVSQCVSTETAQHPCVLVPAIINVPASLPPLRHLRICSVGPVASCCHLLPR